MQNSQENACARVSFLNKGVFLWILQNFLKHLFYTTPTGDCFWLNCKTSNRIKTSSYFKFRGSCSFYCHDRSNHQRFPIKKGVLRSFAKFTEKHFCQSLFCNKVAGLRPANLLKKRFWHSCFPVNFAKFLRTPFLQNTSSRMLLLWVFCNFQITAFFLLLFNLYTYSVYSFSLKEWRRTQRPPIIRTTIMFVKSDLMSCKSKSRPQKIRKLFGLLGLRWMLNSVYQSI